MDFKLDRFADVRLSGALLDVLIDEHVRGVVPRLRRLWRYYRNPSIPTRGAGAARGSAGGGGSGGGRPNRLGQEEGLPARLGGRNGAGWWSRLDAGVDDRAAEGAGREVVIENDIAWRLNTMVDFLFGKPVRFVSLAGDEGLRGRIEAALDRVWEASGGIALLQDLALLGHVYGHVDVVVRAAESADTGRRPAPPMIEVIEPTRGIALLNPGDFRTLDAYVIHFEREGDAVAPAAEPGYSRAARRWLGRGAADSVATELGGARRSLTTVTEVLSGSWRQVYHDEGDGGGPRLVFEGPNGVSPGGAGVGGVGGFGGVPVVHIQNQSQPFMYEGLSEVEPLIPLQDELNTRLSDRASRVTLQCFKMYLAKGMEKIGAAGVAPGTVWTTDNPDASIEAFGGDSGSPSEEKHIEEIREALDKTSGVPPLATGVVRAKVGNLTSENALRITLTGLLARTARKRVTYGRGLSEVCRLVLSALNQSGELPTDEADRAVRIDWPDPLPRNENDVLAAAKAKVELGLSGEQVLAELGYSRRDEGVV